MKRALPIHTFLFAFFFIASPMITFIGDIEIDQALRILALSVPVNILLLGILWLITRNLQHAAFAGTLLWISLGLTSMPMLTSVPEWVIPVRATWFALLVLWALIAAFIVPKRFWRLVKDPSKVTFFLNVVGVCSISYSAFMMVSATVRMENWKNQNAEWLNDKLAAQTATIDDPPDIYYVVLDGYGREDILREMYAVNNGPFLDQLREMGFFIADEAHSNYMQTVLSLSSSLNLQYLDEQIQIWGQDSADRRLPTEMIRHSLVRGFLEARGYRTVDVESGYYPTEIQDADERVGLMRPHGINAYEQFWVLYSPLVELIPKDEFGYPTWGYEMHRERIIQGLESLAQVSAEDGPKFVFAHVIAAHPPFVLQADGTPVPEARPYQLVDGGQSYESHEEFISGYVGQVSYINRLLLEIVPTILRNSKRPPVIILQGDHGPGSKLDWYSAAGTCLWERTSNFNAYYLPEAYRAGLYPSITPVNSFRYVFREIFGADYPPLEDVTYYSTWAQPYRLENVEDRINTPCYH
jgi:hypothetical protein